MPESRHPGSSVPPHVAKESIPAAVRTKDQLIVGLLHARPNKRLKDELNHNSEHYVAITEARVYDVRGGTLLYESRFLLVAAPHVVTVTPLSAVGAGAGTLTDILLRATG